MLECIIIFRAKASIYSNVLLELSLNIFCTFFKYKWPIVPHGYISQILCRYLVNTIIVHLSLDGFTQTIPLLSGCQHHLKALCQLQLTEKPICICKTTRSLYFLFGLLICTTWLIYVRD